MKLNHAVSALLASLLLIAAEVQAALSTDAQAAYDALEQAGTDHIGAGWGIAIVVVVGLTGIKLFKKSVSRAT